MPTTQRHRVTIGGRELSLSNLDKVLYPQARFTKADAIAYYAKIAPVLLPHLQGRPITLKRFPDGTEGTAFYEKNCPAHRPPWVETAVVESERKGKPLNFCLVEDEPTLIWAVNLAALELHPYLHLADAPDHPRIVVFDMDPGPNVTTQTAAEVALAVRKVLEGLGLTVYVKHSGGKGLHLAAPLNGSDATYDTVKPFAQAIAQLMARRDPQRITANMSKAQRSGRVFIDWSQNTRSKTTVGVYSLRVRDLPRVSLPLTWPEVEAMARGNPPPDLSPTAALARVEKMGDLWANLLTTPGPPASLLAGLPD